MNGRDDDLEAIKALIGRGEYDEAARLCEEALARGEGDPRPLILKAEILMGRKDYDGARRCVDAVLSRDPSHAWALRVKGEICAEAGDPEAAAEQFQTAIRLDGSSGAAWSYLGLGKLHILKGEHPLAIEALEKALSLAPDSPGILYALERARHPEREHLAAGEAHIEAGRYDLAEKELNEAIRLAPSGRAYRALIGVYKKQKKVDLCVEASAGYMPVAEAEERVGNLELERRLRSAAKDPRRDGEFRVKIVKTPYFEPGGDDAYNYSLLLPLGLGQIVSYLRANGIAVDQDDLYIKISHDNMFGAPEDRIDPDVFSDEKRVLAYAAGGLDAGIESLMERIEAKTKLAGYPVILLSIAGDPSKSGGALFVLALARYLKARYGPFIMVGGIDSEIDSLLRYDTRHIDLIGRGRGERLLFAVLTALRYGVSIEAMPGLPVRRDGKVVRAHGYNPFWTEPDYDGLPLQLYRYRHSRDIGGASAELKALVDGFNGSGTAVSPYMSMEGCFYGCIFCNSSSTSQVTVLSPRDAVARLRGLKEKYRLDGFFFLHPLINISKKYLDGFCDEIIGSGLDVLWSDCARADNLDRDTLLKMRRAGCVRLVYGMETASPRLLRYIDKRISLRRLEDILRWSDEAGIMNGLEVICGFPGETDEDVRMTVDFIERNRERLDFVYCNTLYIEKQSRLCLSPERYGIRFLADGERREGAAPDKKVRYDEIDGLRWEDRLRQMGRAYGAITECIKRVNLDLHFYENEHFMFYLYSRLKDKKKVVQAFRGAADAVSA
ncbi:MAG: tetratricopeptide repeat protein [Elusimicrobia bacterium]|nr:tetratricopeptide repeat protein [Elusimicrobiota bacterium]